jgi:RNA polymerase sigma-70 factor (ECF subfamily)
MLLHGHIVGVLIPAGLNALAVAGIVRWRSGDPDAELLDGVCAGDEQAFLTLVTRHQAMLLRVARSFVPSAAVAEEVVQDTWVGVLRGLPRFAGRSTFRTWLLSILVNRARSTGVAENRSVPVGDAAGPVVDAARFDASGAWAQPPRQWSEEVEDRVLAQSLADRIAAAIEQLPARQREVVMLRDVDGLTSEEVCEALEISEGNQRVLLHRGRSRLRSALETEMEGL